MQAPTKYELAINLKPQSTGAFGATVAALPTDVVIEQAVALCRAALGSLLARFNRSNRKPIQSLSGALPTWDQSAENVAADPSEHWRPANFRAI